MKNQYCIIVTKWYMRDDAPTTIEVIFIGETAYMTDEEFHEKYPKYKTGCYSFDIHPISNFPV